MVGYVDDFDLAEEAAQEAFAIVLRLPGTATTSSGGSSIRPRVHPHLFRSALGRRAAIIEYQVRQTSTGAAIGVRCRGAIDLECLSRELEEGLAGLGVERPEVTIDTLDRLERSDGPAKLKRFIPLPAARLPAHRGQDGSPARRQKPLRR